MSLIEVHVFTWGDSSFSSLLMPKVSSNAHLRRARVSWNSTHYVEVSSIPRRFRILVLPSGLVAPAWKVLHSHVSRVAALRLQVRYHGGLPK
jgi:hypothetical protein